MRERQPVCVQELTAERRFGNAVEGIPDDQVDGAMDADLMRPPGPSRTSSSA